MIVKCPQCSTGYNIPESVITEKPRKMRCSRCTNLFTLHRRSQAAPTGYEEFTGKQELPAEFAFLREASARDEPPLARPVPAAPAPETPVSPPPPQEGLYQRLIEQDGETCETIPLEPPMVTGPTVPAARPETAAAPAAAPAPLPAEIPEATQPTTTGAADIYDTSRSAWEMEAPLELAGFVIADEPVGNTAAQTAGKVFLIGLVLLVVFFVFVAYRNGWSLSLSELPEQVAFAFSGAEYEAVPAAARDIEPSVLERSLVQTEAGGHYLVVTGTVFNSALTPRREVLLRGRLLDGGGDIRGETRAPCGRVLDEQVIRATAPEAVDGHYRQDGIHYDCRIRAEGSTSFQLVFTDVPVDYGGGFTVDVRAVAAVVGD